MFTRSVDHGHTLVEALVVVAIVSTLAAISFPVLRMMRIAGLDTVSLSRVGECAQLLHTYSFDRGGRVPLGEIANDLVDSNRPTTTLEMPNGNLVAFTWFAHASSWNLVLRSLGEPDGEVWRSPSRTGDSGAVDWAAGADYLLTHAAMTNASYWLEESAQTSENCVASRFSDARHPSKKALLWERWRHVVQRRTSDDPLAAPTPVSFFDLHARLAHPRNASDPVVNRFAGDIRAPLLTTRLGIDGYDY